MESAQLQREQTKSESGGGGTQKSRATVTTVASRPLSLKHAHSPALRLGHAFGSLHTPLPHALQAKLTVNEPGDRYEQEADRVAEQVMRMADPPLRLHRKCGCGGSTSSSETCEECASHTPRLQRRADAENSSGPAVAPLVVHNVLRSSGQPLDKSTRAFMEQRFGHDFGRVRVHADAPAAESARAVNALAYTVGNDVAFSVGQYAPHTAAGKRLLAHELAHVIQQSGASVSVGKAHRPSALNSEETEMSHQQPTGELSLSSLPVEERTGGNGLHRRLSPEVVSNARPAGGIERVADKMMASAVGSGDGRLARLNQLRTRLGGISNLSLSREAATVFQEAYERARASLPRWVPVPSLNFLGALAPTIPLFRPVPVHPVLIIILLVILIVYLLVQFEQAPTTTPDRQRELDEVLDRVDEIIRGQRSRATREPAPSPEPEGQPRPRNPQPVDPISPPQEEEPCCCCVNSVEILNSANIHASQRLDDHRMGHHFETAFGLSYRGTGEKRSCTLEWWESTNLPYARDMQPDQYSNRYGPGISSFAGWDSRPEPCPGDPPAVVDADDPSIPKSMGDARRFLRFVIIARSGRGCVCPNSSIRITARQLLLLQNGVPNWFNSDFLVPNPMNDPAAPR